MVRFMYSAKVENLEEIDQEMLAVADLYEIDELKNLCAFSLCKKLSNDNVFDMLKLSELHRVIFDYSLEVNFN